MTKVIYFCGEQMSEITRMIANSNSNELTIEDK